MNAINKALNEIKFAIPEEVLNIAFMEYSDNTINKIVGLDERITSAVIRPRVLVDCNLVGGITTKIDINRCRILRLYTGEYTVDVPKEITQGKSIVAAHELVCNVIYTNQMPSIDVSPMLSAASTMYNNLATHNVIQTSRLELIGENLILVHDPSIIIINGVLRCTLEHDQNMTALTPRAYLKFGKLCALATKAYIYKKLKIKLDQGYIYGGHELSSITEVVDSYQDANEQYEEYLEKTMRKVLFMSQSDNLNRYVKSMFGNNT